MQALKEVRKVAKSLGISSFKTLKGIKKGKSVEELQREIHKKIVKQQAAISSPLCINPNLAHCAYDMGCRLLLQ